MNESDFEQELRTLRPRPSSEALGRKIEQELRDGVARSALPGAGRLPRCSARVRSIFTGLGWAAVGAAAALAVLAGFSKPDSTAPLRSVPATDGHGVATSAGFERVESAGEVLSAEDGGLLVSEDREPTQVMRFSSVERHAWVNAATGASVEIEVPREDVVLLPVSFQ